MNISSISFEQKGVYEHLEDDLSKWPINILTKNRSSYLNELEEYSFSILRRKSDQELKDLIEKTVYQEKLRIKMDSWRIDPPNDINFWKKISKQIIPFDAEENTKNKKIIIESVLKQVIHRYADEIVGTFNPRTFKIVKKVVTFLFKRLLGKGISPKSKNFVLNRLKIYGPIDHIRNLAKDGILVFVPTHSSNLDSLLVGYAADYKLGVEGVAYGAGLNLYNFGPAAYFMNRLGAYRVDRRKKSLIYLSTLNAMSKLAIQKGTDTLFFPGGTRSRAGFLESKLKLGLLSTSIEAQRTLLQQGSNKKIYVVPLIISYHFVLEAKTLIEDYLKKSGKERYMKSKYNVSSFNNWVKFIWQFLTKSTDITLSYGKPMDVFGNFVNQNGESRDARDATIDIQSYFMVEGKLVTDYQRESEYTRILSEKIVYRYHAENIVLTSHFVAFLSFKLLEIQHNSLDLFGLISLYEEDYEFNFNQFIKAGELLKSRLFELALEEKLKCPEVFLQPMEFIVKNGIARLGTYHGKRPLKFNKKKNIICQDFRLLYFYHNRLGSYDIGNIEGLKQLNVINEIAK